MNTGMLLEMAAEAAPDRDALAGLTYRELFERSRRCGGAIAARGISRVAYLGVNSPDVATLLFGCGLAGAAFAPLNYRLGDAQLAEAVRRLAPVTVVLDETATGRIRAGAGVEVVEAADLADGDPGALPPFVDADRVAVLLLTSGTSGPPKAAVLRHRHLTGYVLSTVEFGAADEHEAILVSVPPYHIAAISSVLTSVYSGRRMVQLSSFIPDEWVATATLEQVTHAMVVPTMLGRILDVLEAEGESLPRLRHLSYGGGRMPRQTVERALRLLPHVDLVNAYGLTETSSTITLLGPDDHREAWASDDPAVRARLGSVGRPAPGVELQVRDEQGAAVGPGVAGAVFVRGEQVSGEYLSHRATDADGWYPTNDRGYLDEAGYLFLDGRADDVIVRGGENISPGEIEDVLLDHPAVAEAAVLGLPDVEWGERVEAVVVLVPGAEEAALAEQLQDLVRGRLRSTRVPAVVHVRPALPATDTGKVLRRVLRHDLLAERSRSGAA